MNLFDQFGVKEVADVTIYSVHKKNDNSGEVYYVPALYLDTLKVTTTEKTAENTWATGGLGNSRLISWDYSKEINLTLEDALVTPASLGLCWGGILGADWKDGRVDQSFGIKHANNCGVERINRMEKCFYPCNDNTTISELLPRDGHEEIYEDAMGEDTYLSRSSVIDGTIIKGFGTVNTHPYKWYLAIESAVKSVAVVPNRFFSIYGKGYPIKYLQTVGINQPSESFKYEIIYLRGASNYGEDSPKARILYNKQQEQDETPQKCYPLDEEDELNALEGVTSSIDVNTGETVYTYNYPFLKIRVCLDGSIRAYLGKNTVDWDLPDDYSSSDDSSNSSDEDKEWFENSLIDTSQFKGIDLWERFDSLNAMCYYLLTKYCDDIYTIEPKYINSELQDNTGTDVQDVVGLDYTLDTPSLSVPNTNCTPCCRKNALSNVLWCYVNPKTMTPYDDDYWFHQGEPYLKKSCTLSTKEAPLNAQRITVTAGDFPGMYKIVGETYIRSRETGEDQRMQFEFPLCKLHSDQTFTLEADGDPTTLTIDVEVAVPESGKSMEITFYDVEKETKTCCGGKKREKDGSTRVTSR